MDRKKAEEKAVERLKDEDEPEEDDEDGQEEEEGVYNVTDDVREEEDDEQEEEGEEEEEVDEELDEEEADNKPEDEEEGEGQQQLKQPLKHTKLIKKQPTTVVKSNVNNDDDNANDGNVDTHSNDAAFPDEDEETITMIDVIEREDKSNEFSEERLMTELGKMDRTAAIEAIHGYNTLKEDLTKYLRKFADSKKVVREQDINEFFDQMRAKKRKLEWMKEEHKTKLQLSLWLLLF